MGSTGAITVYVLRAKERMKLTDVLLATKGENVLIDLPLEVDAEVLGNGFRMSGSSGVIDWSTTSFFL